MYEYLLLSYYVPLSVCLVFSYSRRRLTRSGSASLIAVELEFDEQHRHFCIFVHHTLGSLINHQGTTKGLYIIQVQDDDKLNKRSGKQCCQIGISFSFLIISELHLTTAKQRVVANGEDEDYVTRLVSGSDPCHGLNLS
jgi:hypothetical protein